MSWLSTKKKAVVEFHWPTWLLEETYHHRHTPDAVILERRERHNFFLCDGLMSGRHQNHLLGSDRLKVANVITEKDYYFLNKDAGDLSISIPMSVSPSKDAVKAPIRGELWTVPPKLVIDVLDQEYENGEMFTRERIKLIQPVTLLNKKVLDLKDRSEYLHWAKTPYLMKGIDAWMYVGNPNYWLPMLSSLRGNIKTTKNGITEKAKMDRNGSVYASNAPLKPNNPLLRPYHFFTHGLTTARK